MAELASLVQRLEVAVSRLEAVSGPGGSAGDSAGGAVAAYVEAYDEILKGPMAQYLTLSQKIGGDVQKHAEMMKKVFDGQRQLLAMASTCQNPGEAAFQALLKPLSDPIAAVIAFREKSRSSPFFNHLSAVSEGVPAFGWITVVPKPCPFVKDMHDSAMFYTNRVLKEYKDKDKTHVEWAKAFVSIFTELQSYIKQYHTTGLTWSKSGPVASASAAPPSAPAGGCPPPPPPGPPPPPMDLGGSSSDSAADDRNALFSAINQGSAITKGLKHVSDDQKTHKNPNLRSQGPSMCSGPKPYLPAPRPAAPAAAPAAAASKAEPVLLLDGKKWRVENQDGAQELVISDTELRQVVYVFKCTNSVLRVKGKINSIILDNCKKMGLVFDDVVGIVEIINCKSANVQVLGKMPTISINKTDGCQIYLSKDSLECEIISAKSSEMNILLPKDDGDFDEQPVPEQFKTLLKGGKLVTTAAEISG